MNIRKEAEKYRKKIAEWQTKMAMLQDDCPHTNATKKACSNTGNYDPFSDYYWNEFKCPDCGKFWMGDQ